MITVVSIVLYGVSVFFAMTVGMIAAEQKDGRIDKSVAFPALALTTAPFLLAVCLQALS